MNQVTGILEKYFSPVNVSGWVASVFYFVSEHYQLIGGMILTGSFVFYSILKNRTNYLHEKNEEQRAQERFEQEMRQDEERHQKQMKEGDE